MRHAWPAAILSLVAALPAPAAAQIKIGVTVSATGPAASLGIPERNALTLAPKSIGGQSVEFIVLDDGADPTNSRRNMDRLITEYQVDLVIGSSTTPASLPLIDVAGSAKTPTISLGAARAIIAPMDQNRRWVFKTPYNDAATAAATVAHMKRTGVRRVATMAVADAYGEGWIKEFRPLAEQAGVQIVASETFGARDTTVTAQTLRLAAARPDAVLVAASGTPGALPQLALFERGYPGKVYQTTGVVNPDFLRIGGKAVNGTLIAADPLSVAADLPADHPAKAQAAAFTKQYDAAFGPGSVSAFAGYAQDAVLLAQAAIPAALASAAPGTEAFRTALRDAIEHLSGVSSTAGLVTMSPDDHNGYSADAPVMIEVRDGRFALAR